MKTLFFLNCQIYDSEGAASDPVNSQLVNLVDKMVKTVKKSWENTTDLRIVKT